MAVDGLKRSNLPPQLKQTEGTSTAKVTTPPVQAEVKGPTDAMGKALETPKVETTGASKHREISTGSGSRIQGDWMSDTTPRAKSLYEAVMKQMLPNAHVELVGPPKGASVAKLGDSSLIGLKEDFFDPKASYETNLAKLKNEGIPRFGLLSKLEREHETAFADEVQKNPESFVEGAMALSKEEAIPTFEVDAEKRQYGAYGIKKKPSTPDERSLRLGINHAMHPTAVAVARLAFMKKLDELQKLPDDDPKKSVFVTNGGCAAGKGSMTEILKRINGDLPFGAVWDAAGEGDARENKWILDACASRGITALFGYGAADATTRYNDVLQRSELSGRVVDVLTFTNSYVEGAKNMRSFFDSAEYKAAHEKGLARGLVVDVGPFNTTSFKYEQAKMVVNGDAASRDIPPTPSSSDVFKSAIDLLKTYTDARTAAGKSNDEVLAGALLPVEKFAQMGALEKL